MTETIKCKFCGSDAKRDYDTINCGICEEYINCKSCGYYYGFAYGNYEEKEPRKPLMYWRYNDFKKRKVPFTRLFTAEKDALPF